jgi:fatty acid desaturase
MNSGTHDTIVTKIKIVKKREGEKGVASAGKNEKARVLSDPSPRLKIVVYDYLLVFEFAGLLALAVLAAALAAFATAFAALAAALATVLAAFAAALAAVFEVVFETLVTLVLVRLALVFAALLAGAASPQAIPRALRPRTVESTITFFI